MRGLGHRVLESGREGGVGMVSRDTWGVCICIHINIFSHTP